MEVDVLQILQIVLAAYGLAVMIAKLTPTQKDDKFLEKIRKIFQVIEDIIPNLKSTKTGIKKQ